MTRKDRVLVLGATGRIGAILLKRWASARALWQCRGKAPGPGWISGDPLGDPGGLAAGAAAQGGVGAVLGLAGRVPGTGDMDANIALGRAAVEIAALAGADRVLIASSAAVYGRGEGPLREDAPLHPETGYGRAKAEMEAECAALGQDLGVSVTALRIGNIAGLDTLLGAWTPPGLALDRFADGTTPRRSYIGVITLAEVLARLCEARDLPPVLNVAAPGAVEMGTLLDAAGCAWTPRPAPGAAIREVVLETTLLQGFCPLPGTAGHPETLVREWREAMG